MAQWNLDHIYPFSETEQLIQQLKQKTTEFKKARAVLSPSMDIQAFLDFLKIDEEITEIQSKLSAYAQLALSENTADGKRNAHVVKISEICTDIANELMFFGLWFKEITDEEAQRFIDASEEYRYTLERIRVFKPYTKKESEEQIINLMSLTGADAFQRLYDIITNKFLFDYKDKKMSQEEINQFKESVHREERKASYDLVLGRYGKEQEVLGEIYKTIANEWKNESLKIRGYKTPISVRNLGNDVPDEAVQALLSVVRKNVGLFQEYFKLKAKLCKLVNMDRYDLYMPYAEPTKEYSYEESKKITLETYKEFDEKAYEYAKQIFDDDHVHSDIVPNKRSGAFCYSITPELAPYILLNHVGKLKDLFTMMHEFGHGIHSLAAQDKNVFTFHAPLPLAETASIFGEMLLAHKLLQEEDKEEKIAVLMRLLDSEYASITRQAYFVVFEQEAHDKIAQGATVEELNELYHDTLKEQFGAMAVPDVFKYEWLYIPHIYHSPFYCYAYAFGKLLVLALYNMYQEEGKDFVPKYMKILSYGGSKAPAEILSEVGIDITQESFWQQGFDIIKEQVEELKKLIANA